MEIICIEKMESTHLFVCKKAREIVKSSRLKANAQKDFTPYALEKSVFEPHTLEKNAFEPYGLERNVLPYALEGNAFEPYAESLAQESHGLMQGNFALYALEQTGGVGSRDNAWCSKKGNLHLSFCLKRGNLAADLPMESVSIYFAFIFKEALAEFGSLAWMKYPNDLYLGDKKIGGVVSAKIEDLLVVSIGLNTIFAPPGAATLDISVDLSDLVEKFAKEIEKNFSWKEILKKFMVEFEKSKSYSFHYEGGKVPLNEALLCEDGSILYQNKRIYSLR